jgi:hypothetical protein
MRRSLLPVVTIALAAAASPAAQDAPTFRAATRLVVQTVTVTDRAGNPIEGLTAADFLVTEDGIAQEIAFLEYRRLRGEAGAARAFATAAAHLLLRPLIARQRRRSLPRAFGGAAVHARPHGPGRPRGTLTASRKALQSTTTRGAMQRTRSPMENDAPAARRRPGLSLDRSRRAGPGRGRHVRRCRAPVPRPRDMPLACGRACTVRSFPPARTARASRTRIPGDSP